MYILSTINRYILIYSSVFVRWDFYEKIINLTFQLLVTYIFLPKYRRDLNIGTLNSNYLSSLGITTWGKRDLCFLRRGLYTNRKGHIVGLLTARGRSLLVCYATWLVQGNEVPLTDHSMQTNRLCWNKMAKVNEVITVMRFVLRMLLSSYIKDLPLYLPLRRST
jgi:hypothetical protein